MTKQEQAYYKTQGKALKQMRKQRGLNQQQMADRLDCHVSYISQIELGNSPLSSFRLAQWGEICKGRIELENGAVRVFAGM